MKNQKTLFITRSAFIAALYIVLTLISGSMGLASGVIQIRLSEIITVLPAFTPAAIPGLAVGCFFANWLTGCPVWDVLTGTAATLIAAVLTYYIGKKNKFLATLPPVLLNAFSVALTYSVIYTGKEGFWFVFLAVGIGELISCTLLGTVLSKILTKNNIFKS